MVFYIDLILILNFLIDYLILLATSKFLKLQYKSWRLAIGATLGALYSLTFFIPSLDFPQLFFSKVILSIAIVLVSFGFKHLIQFIRTIATFYLTSFILGGGVLAIQYMFNIEHEVVNGVYVSRSSTPTVTIIIILASAIAIWFFSNNTIKSIWRKTSSYDGIVEVEIVLGSNNFKCKGLVDTGNRLYDPITRKPVMIVEASNIPFIPAKLKNTYKGSQFDLELFDKVTEEIEPEWLARLQLVPFRTVSREMQFIIAFRPDKVVINNQYVQTRVLIGLDYGELSHDDTYQAIIHPELVAG